MPEGAVYVGRPTKWGNPFEVGIDGTHAECIKLYGALSLGFLCVSKSAEHIDRQRRARRVMEAAQRELRGKDLACWCPLNQPCHADVLLELANA
jgi:hypothetical protein